MFKRKEYHLLLMSLSLMLLLVQCAQQGSISGGSKDTTPPQLIKSDPDTFALNFSSDKIRMDFDEYVELKNVSKNLLITPVLRSEPTVYANGKRVVVKNIDDSLWANTTYVFEFNEAISDITEHNASKGFRYVFSTGDYLDSLELKGQLKKAFTLEPQEDAFIFLYESNEDSLPYLSKPRYIGRSNKDGTFHIRNMKQGEYKVFMCSDENKNYLFDRPNERIDYLDEPLILKADSTQYLSGYLFAEADENQFLISYGVLNPWAFYMSYNRKVDSLGIEAWPDSKFPIERYARSYNAERDSVVFWLTDSTNQVDTLRFFAKADTNVIDTLEMFVFEHKKPKKMEVKSNISSGVLDLNANIVLEFEHPILKMDSAKIHFMQDSNLLDYELIFNVSRRMLTLKANWVEKTKYTLSIDSRAFTDIFGLGNDAQSKAFSTNALNNYGTMEISLSGIEKNTGILMLMDKKGNSIREIYLNDKNSHYFEYLKPGMVIKLSSYESEILDYELPSSVELEVIESEFAVVGDTANNPTKRVKVETGLEVRVPMFVSVGDTIRIKTEDGSYMTRV